MNRDNAREPSGMPDAWSIESMPKDYPYSKYHMQKIGERNMGEHHDRKFIFYQAPDGLVWYETVVWSGGKWRTQEEYLFGSGRQRKRPA